MCDNENVVDSDVDDVILAGYSITNYSMSTEKSDPMQKSSLTRSQYASVVFHGVSDTYQPDGDIVFKYSLTDGVEPTPGDRVVVFAVGWSSIKDYVVFDWAPMPKEGERNSSVLFKAEDLPKDTNEFYQVCYVSNEGSVFGASVPFQIRINNDELIFAIEEDMVVVRSSNDIVKEKLLKAQVDRENLNREKLDVENRLKLLEKNYELKLQEFKNLEDVLSERNSSLEELKVENLRYGEMECELIELRKEFNDREILIDKMKFEKNKIEDDIKSLNIVNDDYKSLINNLKRNEKESEDRLIEAVEKIETMRMTQEKLQNELKINSTDRSNEIDIIRMRNFSLENELTVCKFNLNNSQLENIRLKNEYEELLKLNNELNDKIRDVIETEEIRRNYIDEHSSNGNFDKGKLINENTKLIKTSEELQYRISALEEEKLNLEKVLEETLEAQKEETFIDDDNLMVKKKFDSSSSSSLKKIFVNDKLKSRKLRSNDINDKELTNLKIDYRLLNDRFNEQSYYLIKKEKDIDEFKEIIKSMKNELKNIKIEYNQEISNLLSKNENLVRDERNLQELRNEMQRITFMNEELLIENSGLMERLRKIKSNKLSFKEEDINKESSLELENENLRKQLDTAYKNFDKTWKEERCSVGVGVDVGSCDNSLILKKFIDEKEKSSYSKSTDDDKSKNDSSIIFQITDEKIEEIINRGLEKLNFKFEGINEDKLLREQLSNESSSSSSYSLEPKLEMIFDKVDKVFSVVKKLSNDKENDIKNSISSSSYSTNSVTENYQNNDVEELKERLSRARFEYEKLQGVLIVYKKKYEELKIKYKSKIN